MLCCHIQYCLIYSIRLTSCYPFRVVLGVNGVHVPSRPQTGSLGNGHGRRGQYFPFFWKLYPKPDHDLKNSTLASKACFGPYPLIKCKTHQIWPTLKWKSWFFRVFSSFFTKNPSFLGKFYPSQKNSRNYTGMHIPVFCKIFTPGVEKK